MESHTPKSEASSNPVGLASSGRAATLQGLGNFKGKVFTEQGLEAGLALKLRPTDVVITPFGKCGTTWLQQICHTLRTRGDMDFDDISRVAPWIETSNDLGLDLNAEQKAVPRLFKSHLDAVRIPPGGNYINASRNPKDAAYSMFKFMEGWFIEPNTVSADEYIRAIFLSTDKTPGSSGSDYWSHLLSWWDRRNDTDVLFLVYEHMKNDLTGTICKVAEFMNIELDKELLAITEEHASRRFMLEHNDRFDDAMVRKRAAATCGLPLDSDSSKVRDSGTEQTRQGLGPDVEAELDTMWRRRITPKLGFESYEELIATLR